MSEMFKSPDNVDAPPKQKRKLTLAAILGGAVTAVFEFLVLGIPIGDVIAKAITGIY